MGVGECDPNQSKLYTLNPNCVCVCVCVCDPTQSKLSMISRNKVRWCKTA